MKKLIASMLLTMLLVTFACAEEKAYVATVERIIDGDTVVLADGTMVELIGIDCPEIDTKEGREAADWMKMLVRGRTVQLESDMQQSDEHKRLLAYMYGSPIVGLELIFYPQLDESNTYYFTASKCHGFSRGFDAVLARGYMPRASGEPKARPLTV